MYNKNMRHYFNEVIAVPQEETPQKKRRLGTSQHLQRMRDLVTVIQELSLARDIKKVQEIVVITARKLIGAEGATFVLRDGECCHYVDEEAISPLWKGKRFPVSQCVSGWVMENHKSLIIPDIYKDQRVPIDMYRPTFVKSLTMVPIRTLSPIGAIGNYWSTVHQPSPEELDLLQTLADTTAVALENIQVYNELEERVQERTSELQAANEAIQRLSICDELTGLYNRRGFYLLAGQELKRAHRQHSVPLVLYLDVDGLKIINDQMGHKTGDLLIAEAARVIKASMRDSDIIGRIGGDEFCIMAVDCDHEAVKARMKDLIDRFNARSTTFKLSISMGSASPQTQHEKLDSLLSRADQEMYAAKRFRKEHEDRFKTRH